MKILVTPRSLTCGGHPALRRLEDAGYEVVFCTPGKLPDERELLQLLPDCVGYLAGIEPINEKILAAAPHLRVISRNGSGVDNVDLAAARRHEVSVCRADGANARGVAELTLALMLALVRSVPFSDKGLKAGLWERREGIELTGRTLGIVGCGRIGKLVAQFAVALDMNVLAYDPFPDAASRRPPRFRYSALSELLERSELVTLHCPPSTDHSALIDAKRLLAMKPGAYLVNTARAELLDEEAVLEALENGTLSGLATDVFREEPPRDLRLLRHSRVVSTPHIGGYTRESVGHAVEAAVDNLLAVLHASPKPQTLSEMNS